MKALYNIITLIVLVIASMSFAQSEPSTTPPPKSHTKNIDYKTNNQQRYADNSTSINKAPATQTGQQTTNSDIKKRNDKAITDFWIMCATVAIAIFAFFQVVAMVFQYCVMRKQAKELQKSVDIMKETSKLNQFNLFNTRRATTAAQVAADAAKKSADALPAIERAYVFVTVAIPDVSPLRDGADPSKIYFRLRNHGKTPAILKKIRLTVKLENTYPTRTEITNEPHNPFPPGVIINSNETTVETINAILNKEDCEQIDRMKTKLLCYGTIEYEDVLRENRVTGFCWEYYPRRSCADISNNQELNYYT